MIALISGAFTTLGAILTILFVSRKQAKATEIQALAEAKERDAQIDKLKDEVTAAVLARASTEINKLNKRIEALESELEEYKIGVGLLMGQLINANMQPTWKPRGVMPKRDTGEVKRS